MYYQRDICGSLYTGTFIDNHDNSRFLFSQSSYTLYKNAIAMTLFTQGIPIIYYGTEQGYNGGDDPKNRLVCCGRILLKVIVNVCEVLA